METQECEIFSKSLKLTKLNSVRTPSFRMPRKKTPWLRQYQSYISNWYVNGKVFTSTTTWEPKIWFFFSRKFEIEFNLYFVLCWRAEIIQVGLNMHLYVDIGDASSSLWGSTSSYNLAIIMSIFYKLRPSLSKPPPLPNKRADAYKLSEVLQNVLSLFGGFCSLRRKK